MSPIRTWSAAVLLPAALAASAEPPAGDTLALPKVTADRAARQVRIEAESTGIDAGNPMEFYLIARASGHDYEAFAVTDARPSDVHRALEFIGLAPGKPVDPQAARFWPRGARVRVTFATADGTRFDAEATLRDRRTGRSPPSDGFFFVGSAWEPSDPAATGRVYAADAVEPNSIVSAFNCATTVLDIPRLGSQGALYDHQVRSPVHVLAKGAALTVILEPDPRAGPREMAIRFEPGGAGPTSFVSRVAAADGPADAAAMPPDALAKRLAEARRDGLGPVASVAFADGLPVAAATAAAEFLAAQVDASDVRVDAPADGQLFFRAYTPDPAHRARAGRPSQPCELRVRAAEGGTKATLVALRRSPEAPPDAEPEAQDIPVGSPAAFAAALREHGSHLPVLLVFAGPGLTCGELRAYLEPVRTTHPMVFVYLDPATP